MNTDPRWFLCLLLACAGCAGSRPSRPQDELDLGRASARSASPQRSSSTHHRVSGMIGISEVNADVKVDSSFGQVVDDDRLSVPTIGAAWQLPVVGERLELGVESGFSLGWDNERRAVVVNDGSLTIFADNSVRLFDVSLGAYASVEIVDRLRVYGGGGPLLQYASVDLDLDRSINGRDDLDDDGFGYGYYARVGIELEVYPGTGVGVVGRLANSEVNLGSPLGDFGQESLQVAFVVTSSF